MDTAPEYLNQDDLYCVSCGESLLGDVVQVCPPRRFRYDAQADLWLEQPQTGEYYFVCAHCGERLDEDVQDYLFEGIASEEMARASLLRPAASAVTSLWEVEDESGDEQDEDDLFWDEDDEDEDETVDDEV